MKASIYGFGDFLAGMLTPNAGAFTTWGWNMDNLIAV
jgi:mannitol-specific phosphotransferase system IIBC component